jgi:kojibiose phosphorylase
MSDMNIDQRWALQVDGFDPTLEPTIEAVLALVNGYLGTRAALEEGSDVSRPATFIAGVFNVPPEPQTPELPHPISELVVVPNWARLRIEVEGQELRLDKVELLEQRRVLDMRQGVLTRDWRVCDSAGRITRLRSVRFASLHDRHMLFQQVTLTPENYSGRVMLESTVDGRVSNANNAVNLAPILTREIAHGALLTMQTTDEQYRLACAAHTDLLHGEEPVAGTLILDERVIGRSWAWHAEQGQTYELRKIVAVTTSRDTATPDDSAVAKLDEALHASSAELLQAHAAAWEERWSTCDALIEQDEEIQRQVRFAFYHLIGAANPHDERASVGARSLTGERYRGHVFWDTETFVWPPLLCTHPQTARSLLMYRYHNLEGARHKAQSLGYRGALYPWESTDTGEETTPPYVQVPGGELQTILTGLQEHHLSADIAYAVLQYRQVTGDHAFFVECSAEMLLEIARFWASRSTFGDDGKYHILNVIGPDEYHDNVNDNAFTNVMAQWVLRRSLETAAELQRDHPAHWQALAGRINLTPEELEEWRRVADGLVTNFDPQTGLFEQFRGYYDLAEYDLTRHDTAQGTLDVKLGWAALQTIKPLKQADVVMLMFLLWDEFPPEVREANFRYYEPRTTHDSSLSASFHALVAARLGDMPMAERYLRQAARIDLDFTRKGWAGATGGVHIAALGGIWQALAFGFLGMRPQDEGIRFTPHIPADWGALSMPIQWRGRQLRVTATTAPASVTITVESGEPVSIAIGDAPWQTVAASERVSG